MSDEALRITIPHGVHWSAGPDWGGKGGLVLDLHLSGDEDYSELGQAFIHIGVVVLAHGRDKREAAA